MTKLPCLLAVLALLISSQAWAKSQEFVLKTLDGLATFGGQIDFPDNCYRDRYKTVVLVGGTGLYYRNYRNTQWGLRGTERELIFKDLSGHFTQKCLAVVRYDFRGVSCDLSNDDDVKKCLDQSLRKSVNAKTIIDDIQAVYDYAIEHPRLNRSQIVFLAHSEGSLNVSRLWQRKSIDPAGFVFIGGVVESPQSLVRWQFVNRSVDQAFAMDTDGDGLLTNWEVTLGYPGSFFDENDIPILNLLSPAGAWNRFGLTQFYATEFNVVRNTTLLTPDFYPYIQKGIVYSSVAWWKEWFTDSEPVVAKLKDFEGRITYFNGTMDVQVPARKQQELLKHYARRMRSTPEFNLIEGRGHLLGNHPLYGPIDEVTLKRVVNSVLKSFSAL